MNPSKKRLGKKSSESIKNMLFLLFYLTNVEAQKRIDYGLVRLIHYMLKYSK